MSRPTTREEKEIAASDALYRALVRYDREVRSARDLRAAQGGRGPTIKRGTKRAALARFLATEVVTALEDEGWAAGDSEPAAKSPVEQMYARLAEAYRARPPVPDRGGGVPEDRFEL